MQPHHSPHAGETCPLAELFQTLGMTGEFLPVPGDTLLNFIKATRDAVDDRQVLLSIPRLYDLLKAAFQAAQNEQATRRRSGLYLSEGQLYAHGVPVKKLKGRYLEIVIYILQHGSATVPELKQRFWTRNDEEEVTDKTVANTIGIINRKTSVYNFVISSDNLAYRIFS